MKWWILALVALASPAGATWREASSRHFLIYSEQSEKDLRDFATRLERYDSAMRADHSLPDTDRGPANRLTVYVLPETSDVQKLLHDTRGTIAGAYQARAGASVAFTSRRAGNGSDKSLDAETILRHEYAHYFMLENYAMVAFPRWYSEGFAEFNAAARINANGSVDLGLPAVHRAYGLTHVRTLSMKDLFEPNFAKFTPLEGDAFYGRAWELTHMLTFDPARKGQLAAFLVALNQGKSGLEAAKAAFGNLGKLEGDLDAYLKRTNFPSKTIPAANITIGPVAVRELTAGEAAAMPVRLVSKRGVDPKGALELVPRARAAAAPYPNDYGAQIMLAEAEFDAGNLAEAEAAAARAAAADPKATAPLLYKGYVEMARARAAKSKDPAVWRGVRRSFIAANRLDPNDPLPLIAFYDSFGAAGEKPTDNAVAALDRAYRLAPQDKELRWKMGHQFLIAGDAAQARSALAPLAYYPEAHGGLVEFAAKVLEKLDSGGAAAALAEWDRLAREQQEKAAKGGSEGG